MILIAFWLVGALDSVVSVSNYNYICFLYFIILTL